MLPYVPRVFPGMPGVPGLLGVFAPAPGPELGLGLDERCCALSEAVSISTDAVQSSRTREENSMGYPSTGPSIPQTGYRRRKAGTPEELPIYLPAISTSVR
jgi:hypothetical protein